MKRDYCKTVIFLLLVAMYAVFSVWRCSFLEIDSDFANLVLEGKCLLNGNFFRKGWNLTGISFLFTDLPYFVIGVAVAGVSNKAYIIACGLMQTALVVTAFLLAKSHLRKHKVLGGTLFVAFAMIPCIFCVYLLRAHTGVFVASFLAVWFIQKLCQEQQQSIVMYIILVLIIALAVMSDPIILILLIAPVCLWGVISWMKNDLSLRKCLNYLGVCAFGSTLGFILDKLYFFIGGCNKNNFLGGQHFVTFDEIHNKFVVYCRSVMMMPDAAFENNSLLNIQTLFFAVNSLAVGLFFVLLFYNICCFCSGRKYDFVTVILGSGFLLMSILFVLTTISTGIASARYMGFFPALMAIVFIRNLDLIAYKGNTKVYGLVLLTAIVVVAGRFYDVITERRNPSDLRVHLIDVLEENNLKNGYSSFWNASSCTVLSKENVKVRAITGSEDCIRMYNWFCKNEWYSEPANFIVVSNNDEYGCTYENAVKSLGQPVNVIDVDGDNQVLVYNYDISTCIVNGFRDGYIRANEWYRNDLADYVDRKNVLHQGGMLFGPYDQLKSGEYTVRCYGSNVPNAQIDVFSNSIGGALKELERIGDDESFDFSLQQDVNDLELRVFNNDESDVVITHFRIEPAK